MATQNLTAERLRAALQYDPETGTLVWRESNGRRAYKGAAAGGKCPKGYITISLDGGRYKAHRLAWLHVHGIWPEGQIDHINGAPGDNRIANLRDVDVSTNQQNLRRARSNNRQSGLLGVRKMSKTTRWWATISVNGGRIYLGSYATPDEAHQAYLTAKRKLHKGCTI